MDLVRCQRLGIEPLFCSRYVDALFCFFLLPPAAIKGQNDWIATNTMCSYSTDFKNINAWCTQDIDFLVTPAHRRETH